MSLLLCTIKKASYANVVKFYNQSSKNMEWNIQNENMEEQHIFKILFLLLLLQFLKHIFFQRKRGIEQQMC